MSFATTPRVEIRVLDPRLRDWGLPDWQTTGAAALDLRACLDAPVEIVAGRRRC